MMIADYLEYFYELCSATENAAGLGGVAVGWDGGGLPYKKYQEYIGVKI